MQKIQFFEKIFLLTNINIKIVVKISFLSFSNINIWFTKRKITYKKYTAIEILFIIKKIEFINKKKFVIVILNTNNKIFVIYIIALDIKNIEINI